MCVCVGVITSDIALVSVMHALEIEQTNFQELIRFVLHVDCRNQTIVYATILKIVPSEHYEKY